MELIDAIQQIAKIYTERKDIIRTEEATKNALIMPFISALGYNVFDPFEVIPEFTADVGTKKGEKVDYAIMKDDKPIMLIEAKWCGDTLDITQESQLLRYFNATAASIGILTNGYEYRFYTDLDEKNKMDQKPFLQFNICEINDLIVKELKKFAKLAFNIDEIMSTAEELKYTGAMKSHLAEQFAEPSDDFVRYMAKQVFEGKLTEKAQDKFKVITKKAFTQFVSDRVSDRLASALIEERAAMQPVLDESIPVEEEKSKIVTTQDEIDGFNIVRSILREKIDAERVVMKDTINYCGVLFDGNARRPLCRFYFNNPEKKALVTFDAEKKEIKHPIHKLEEIYKYSEDLFKTLAGYLQSNSSNETHIAPIEGV
jgi:hypothetical protein